MPAPADAPSDAPGDAPRRIRIVGTSGSGKSRLAERVAARTGLPRLDLDAVFWDRDWTQRDVDEARSLIRAFVACAGRGPLTFASVPACSSGSRRGSPLCTWPGSMRSTRGSAPSRLTGRSVET
ncbi:hypothetical protein [Microbacterium sp. bgisy203]|uniref:hypothetical protein n=1 Tax=Microbacterium sp. bgisy203 TaxID=3413799 RepID=UPI003D71CE0D